jgi:hypothetical protein
MKGRILSSLGNSGKPVKRWKLSSECMPEVHLETRKPSYRLPGPEVYAVMDSLISEDWINLCRFSGMLYKTSECPATYTMVSSSVYDTLSTTFVFKPNTWRNCNDVVEAPPPGAAAMVSVLGCEMCLIRLLQNTTKTDE